MSELGQKFFGTFVSLRVVSAAVTTVAIVAGLAFRPELRSDPRLVLVVGFALLCGLITALLEAKIRWKVAAFLIAAGLGLVVGLHPPMTSAAASADRPRFSAIP